MPMASSTSPLAICTGLLRKLELDTVTLTYQHRTLGVQDHMIGGQVEAWLDGMKSAEIERLIDTLRARL